jgi:hypothetical protein
MLNQINGKATMNMVYQTAGNQPEEIGYMSHPFIDYGYWKGNEQMTTEYLTSLERQEEDQSTWGKKKLQPRSHSPSTSRNQVRSKRPANQAKSTWSDEESDEETPDFVTMHKKARKDVLTMAREFEETHSFMESPIKPVPPYLNNTREENEKIKMDIRREQEKLEPIVLSQRILDRYSYPPKRSEPECKHSSTSMALENQPMEQIDECTPRYQAGNHKRRGEAAPRRKGPDSPPQETDEQLAGFNEFLESWIQMPDSSKELFSRHFTQFKENQRQELMMTQMEGAIASQTQRHEQEVESSQDEDESNHLPKND